MEGPLVDGLPEASNGGLQNMHGPSKACNFLFSMGPPKLVISLFSQSVERGRRQLLIIRVEHGPPGSETGVKCHLFPSFGCANTIPSDKSPFLAPDKRPESISDPQEVISGRSDYTHVRRALSGLQVQRTLISQRRWPHRLVDDSPIR